jgi:hypothetical protein
MLHCCAAGDGIDKRGGCQSGAFPFERGWCHAPQAVFAGDGAGARVVQVPRPQARQERAGDTALDGEGRRYGRRR